LARVIASTPNRATPPFPNADKAEAVARRQRNFGALPPGLGSLDRTYVYEASRKRGLSPRGQEVPRHGLPGGGGQVDDAIGDAAITKIGWLIWKRRGGGDGERTKASGHVDRSAATCSDHNGTGRDKRDRPAASVSSVRGVGVKILPAGPGGESRQRRARKCVD